MATPTEYVQRADHTYWRTKSEIGKSRQSSFLKYDHVYSKSTENPREIQENHQETKPSLHSIHINDTGGDDIEIIPFSTVDDPSENYQETIPSSLINHWKKTVAIAQETNHSSTANKHSKNTKKRKRALSPPIEETLAKMARPRKPVQLQLLVENKQRHHILWTAEEKDFLISYAAQTPRGDETIHEYWSKCAEQINVKFPGHNRTGNKCKGQAQRMFVSPGQPASSKTIDDVGSQTDFKDMIKSDRKTGDSIFLEPNKELKEDESYSDRFMHRLALKRLRQYAPLTSEEQKDLVDLIYNGTPTQIARGILGIESLKEEIKNMTLFDLEIEAHKCSIKKNRASMTSKEQEQLQETMCEETDEVFKCGCCHLNFPTICRLHAHLQSHGPFKVFYFFEANKTGYIRFESSNISIETDHDFGRLRNRPREDSTPPSCEDSNPRIVSTSLREDSNPRKSFTSSCEDSNPGKKFTSTCEDSNPRKISTSNCEDSFVSDGLPGNKFDSEYIIHLAGERSYTATKQYLEIESQQNNTGACTFSGSTHESVQKLNTGPENSTDLQNNCSDWEEQTLKTLNKKTDEKNSAVKITDRKNIKVSEKGRKKVKRQNISRKLVSSCAEELSKSRPPISRFKTKKQELICKLCGLKFDQRNLLRSHIKSEHLGIPFLCMTCGECCKSEAELIEHRRNLHGQGYFKCELCDKVLSTKTMLDGHYLVHKSIRPFSCKICQPVREFTRESQLKAHMETHSTEKRLQCEYCGKSFSARYRMINHVKYCGGIKPFKCEYCDMKFISNHCLQQHRRKHTGEKPYICEVCGFSSSNISCLSRHMRIHTGERPFTCRHCNKMFAAPGALKKHVRIHTQEKPYKCKYCSKAFTQNWNLKTHERQHTGEAPYKCHVCGAAYKQKVLLQSHLKTHCKQTENQLDEEGTT